MTPIESAKNDFEISKKEILEMCKKKSEGLEKWILEKGGSLDTNGFVVGLSPENQRIFEWKNKELEILEKNKACTEGYIKQLRLEIASLTQCNTLLKAGKTDENMSFLSDKQVLSNANFYMNWRIDRHTSTQDLRRNLKQLIKWIDEAANRILLGDDEARYIEKRNKAAALLMNEVELKKYFAELVSKYFLNNSPVLVKVKPF